MRVPRRSEFVALGLGVALAAAATGCDRPSSGDAPAVSGEPRPTFVDSIFPIEEEIRRFQAAHLERVETLSGGADSRDELVARFIAAVKTGDRQALMALVIEVEEFVYLYYPHTRYTAAPYRMSPSLLWLQLEGYGARGLERLLGRFAGGDPAWAGYHCPGEPQVEELNRTWSGCLVHVLDEAGKRAELPLFGPILEREGRFKFLTYANGL